MADNYFTSPIPPFHTAVGAAFTTFTAFQDISPVPKPIMFGGTLRAGSIIELEAEGEFSTTGTPTLSIGFYYGAVGVVLAASALITTASAAAAFPWHLKYRGRVVSVGTAGSIVGSGVLDLGTSLVAYSGNAIPATAAARTVAIDTTVNKDLGVGAQWGTSSASNSVRVNNFSALLLN